MRTLLARSGLRAGACPGPRSGAPVASGGRDPVLHSVRLIDLTDRKTDVEAVKKRLKAHLRVLRGRRLLLAYFNDLREWEQRQAFGVIPPLDRRALADLKSEFRVSWDDERRIGNRAVALAARREQASGLGHLKDKEQKDRLRRLMGRCRQ